MSTRTEAMSSPSLLGRLKRKIDDITETHKEQWPDPELSIGRPYGPANKSKILYWQAVGPALVAYEQLIPQIQEVIDETQGSLPSADILLFRMYMMGLCESKAYPCIMFASTVSERKRAVKHIRASGILKRHPGVQVGHWPGAPHIGKQTLLGIFSRRTDSRHLSRRVRQPLTTVARDTSSRQDPDNLRSQFVDISISSGKSTTKPLLLAFRFPDRTAEATTGLALKNGAETYFLVPAHALMPSKQSTATGSCEDLQDPDDDNDCDFGEHTDGSPPEQDYADSGTAMPPVDAKAAAIPFVVLPEDRFMAKMQRRDNVLHFSPGLDYAICRLSPLSATETQKPDVRPTNTASVVDAWMPVPPMSRTLEFMKRLSSKDSLRVQLQTSRGIITGSMVNEPAHVRMPEASGFRAVYPVILDKPVKKGDSGARVYCGRKNGPIADLGHMISGNLSTSSVYVMPSAEVYEDVASQPQFKGMASDAARVPRYLGYSYMSNSGIPTWFA